ncbi:MAG TPA: hypothetical protein PLI09_18370 [Candidatus Hydrogenedentes bacterium]|nr:hypothetical protein [Candidatus Hydrogenedentota bacterium]
MKKKKNEKELDDFLSEKNLAHARKLACYIKECSAKILNDLDEKHDAGKPIEKQMIQLIAIKEYGQEWFKKAGALIRKHVEKSLKLHLEYICRQLFLVLVEGIDRDCQKTLLKKISTDSLRKRISEICSDATVTEAEDLYEEVLPRLFEMSFLLLEVDFDHIRGRKSIVSAKNGHIAVHGTWSEKKDRWQRYKDAYGILRKKMSNPPYSNEWCYEKVAKQFGVSSKTIKRHVSQK